MKTTIACPTCQTPISIEASGLLKGTQYTCINCNTKVSLASDSASQVKNAVEEYQKILRNKGEKN
ncbi:hypothetical protein ACU8DI_06440 [Psychroserpens sp. BH13MA-6]